MAASSYFVNSTVKPASFFLPPFSAGFPRLWAALVNYHAGLYPEAAESLVAAPGLHTQKPWCSATAVTAVGTAAAAAHPQRWVCVARVKPLSQIETPSSAWMVWNRKQWITRVLFMFLSDFWINDHAWFFAVCWDFSWLKIMGLLMMMMSVNWAANQPAPAAQMCAGQSGLWNHRVNQLCHTGLLMMLTFCAEVLMSELFDLHLDWLYRIHWKVEWVC